MGVVWGLLAAGGWGVADFMARGVSSKVGAYRALLYAHVVSLCLLMVVIAMTGLPAVMPLPLLALAAVLGALNMVGSLLLYHALAVGQVAIVSPIGSTFAAVTLLLSLLSGDHISPAKIVGLLLTLVGVVVAGTPPAEGHSTGVPNGRGVRAAVGAALVLGLNFWGLKYVVPALGPWIPVLASRVVSLLFLPVLALPLRQSIARPPASLWPLLLAIAVMDTGANTAYNFGLHSDAPGVVAVLGSLFSPITVLLAFVVLRERLSPRQWIGVGMLFVAVGSIGAFAA